MMVYQFDYCVVYVASGSDELAIRKTTSHSNERYPSGRTRHARTLWQSQIIRYCRPSRTMYNCTCGPHKSMVYKDTTR